ncbi:MAG: glycosyltransferase family 4 protein [Candidatus Methanosuratincola sp.]
MVSRLFYPWVGGSERQAHKLAQELCKKGVQVEIVTGWWYRGTPRHEIIDGIPVYRNHTLWEMFGIKGLRKFGGYLYILSLIWFLWRRRGHYDIIHIHGLSYHTFAAVLAGRWIKRKTLTKLVNSGMASDIKKMQKGQHLAFSHYLLPIALGSDRYIALTKTIASELVNAGVPQERIVRLANGVETDRIIAKSDYSLHFPARLIFAGRLHYQKGLDVLLKALKKVNEHDPALPICLQVLGDGPLREDMWRLAEQLGIAHEVEFVGQTEQVIEHFRQADIFILPSRAEGISNALLEAMACGLPVAVSDIPGNLDVVEHEQNGLIFHVEEPDSLAQVLVPLLEGQKLRESLGKAARKTVEKEFSLSVVADRYISVYQELLAVS